jgi:LysR family glycine cleavage system transcriptional activator
LKLPPLNAVKAFEATGRTGSFTRAAAELHVTPGAVSRQVRKLEAHLGADLLIRTGPDLRLTEQGKAYLDVVQDALGRLESGSRLFDAQDGDQPLHIWGSRFFIRLWLVPRLNDFHSRFPEQKVKISAAMPTDPPPAAFDVAIRLAEPGWQGLASDLLIRRELMPVCSPAYLEQAGTLTQPQDLSRHTLIETPMGVEDWEIWYRATGAPPVEMAQRISFTSTDMAYSAALDGLGVVLGRRGFIEGDLRKGRLVAPLPLSCDMGDGFRLFYRQWRPMPARIARFRDWILAHLRDEPQTLAAR